MAADGKPANEVLDGEAILRRQVEELKRENQRLANVDAGNIGLLAA